MLSYYFQQTYANNLVGLYMVIRHCLEQEMKIAQQVRQNVQATTAVLFYA